uniref:LEM domain-containing protein n=1 Tax=Denticeps clupeoides TaxID=299321 RepID=A0AAY4CR12_9TELE
VCKRTRRASVNLFLSQGADPNLVLEKGVAAVHLAVGRESEKGTRCLRLILQHGGDPNLRSSEGLTPLHIAALWGCYQNLRLLLKNGGDPNLRDQDGNKPCDLAEQQENSRCALLPFVTGRTRSRLSRCSVRTSHGSPSLSASGLFEQTLPTAARMQRRTLKSQDNTPVQIHDPSPHCRTARRECPPQGQKPFVSCEEGSQADTLIISGSMADTFILEKGSVEQLLGPSGSSERKPLDKGMTDKALRRQLVELGEEPGPINSRTRPLYIRKLRQLQQGSTTSKQSLSNQCNASMYISTSVECTIILYLLVFHFFLFMQSFFFFVPPLFIDYGVELTQALNTFILPDCSSDELALCEQFDHADQNKRWREGIIKSSFNYLLLDPRVTNNLPYRSRSMSPKECFQTFISAIFYIGKGKRSRPYSHLYEALEYYKGDKTAKVQHILQVWNADQGVISLHCFQNVIPVEAYTREACMVDAIGLKMLTNQKRGDYYGVVSTWSAKKKRELGVHLLYRAMQIFLAEGERQLRPADIRAGH